MVLIRGIALAAFLLAQASVAEQLAAPGDLRLRHDLERLNDHGVINVPLTAWPVALEDIESALATAQDGDIEAGTRRALMRVRGRLKRELGRHRTDLRFGLSASENPRVIRTFEGTPREEGGARADFRWLGERLTLNFSAQVVSNPFDGDNVRLDGSYVGITAGNWLLTAGLQERWFGPGRDGSLILSTNARPTPGIAIQRRVSKPFESKWFHWIGPWTLTSFMTVLDDSRTINDAWFFGLRGSFRPLRGLEIGITRTALWCGSGRPCQLSTFGDLLIGNDNRGINVAAEDEPGNQLGGFDIRWALPRGLPVALYMQWIGEDGRGGGGAIGSWLRQLGVEYRGSIGDLDHRTHFEVTDSMCKEGGFGFSDDKPDCAYGHSIYETGYRYKNRAIGFASDSDSRSYSIGSTLVQSGGNAWNVTLRYMELNRLGAPDARHTLTPTPQELIDVQLTHERYTRLGRFYIGVAFSELDDAATGDRDTDFTGFLSWSSR